MKKALLFILGMLSTVGIMHVLDFEFGLSRTEVAELRNIEWTSNEKIYKLMEYQRRVETLLDSLNVTEDHPIFQTEVGSSYLKAKEESEVWK